MTLCGEAVVYDIVDLLENFTTVNRSQKGRIPCLQREGRGSESRLPRIEVERIVVAVFLLVWIRALWVLS